MSRYKKVVASSHIISLGLDLARAARNIIST